MRGGRTYRRRGRVNPEYVEEQQERQTRSAKRLERAWSKYAPESN